ncbi:histidinol-phosphatase [Sulfurospirillum sp. 1612]|uniref:histidinol-phosphatase n=1 Tax=Sulfurospirillum sp. 1612 TaxID=3094835 RepID=UPI002F95C813
MIVDMHNHTTLCNHAEGSIEDFVLTAIKNKIDVFGFSDHAPMNFDEKYRMRFDQMAQYEAEVLAAKKKYHDDIKILFAYEVDFLEGLIDPRVLSSDVDYLIGSVHFINRWGFDNPEFIGGYKDRDIDEIWEAYFGAITQMAKSRLFDIVGHIDLIKVFNFLPKKEIKLIAQEAIKEIKKADMVVEFNTAGYRKPIQELYPSHEIIELLAYHDIPITFSSDAHKIEDINYKKEEAMALAKTYGYKKCAIFENRERKMVKF